MALALESVVERESPEISLDPKVHYIPHKKFADYIRHQIKVNGIVPQDQYKLFIEYETNRYLRESNLERGVDTGHILKTLYNKRLETGKKLDCLTYYLENDMPELIGSKVEYDTLITIRENLSKSAKSGYLSRILKGKASTKIKTEEERAEEINEKLSYVLDILDDKIQNYNLIEAFPRGLDRINLPVARRKAKIIEVKPSIRDYIFYEEGSLKPKEFDEVQPMKVSFFGNLWHNLRAGFFRKKGQYVFSCSDEDIKKEIPAFVNNKHLKIMSYIQSRGHHSIILEPLSRAKQYLIK